MEKQTATSHSHPLRWIVAVLILVLLVLGLWLFTKRDHVVLESRFPKDELMLRVLVRRSPMSDARLYLEAEEERLGEHQRIYLRSFDGPTKTLGTPRIERKDATHCRILWSMNLVDDVTLSLRALQPVPAPEGKSNP